MRCARLSRGASTDRKQPSAWIEGTKKRPLSGPFSLTLNRKRSELLVVLQVEETTARQIVRTVERMRERVAGDRRIFAEEGAGTGSDLAVPRQLPADLHIVIDARADTVFGLQEVAVRIEDDYLVTKDGYIHLSSSAPRTVADIEALMKQSSALDDFVLPDLDKKY